MKRSLCLLVLTCVGAVAGAEEWAIVGAYEGDMTAEALEARAPVRSSPGVTHEYHRLHASGDGRDVSVFSIRFGKEGVRIQSIRKFAAAGLLAHPLDDLDDCQLDFQQRTGASVEGMGAFYRKADEAVDLRARAEAAAADAAAASAAFDVVVEALADAEADLAVATDLRTAAHEAAHVVQQRAGVALREFQARPSRERLNALVAALADLAKALQAQAAADAALAEAETRAAKTRQEFGPAQVQKKRSLQIAEEADAAADAAEAEAEALRLAAGKLINADIAEATALAAEEAQGLADGLADLASYVSSAKASYGGKTGIGHPNYARLEALEAIAADAAALAAEDAGVALKLAESALRLPAIPQVQSEADLAKLPQSQIADRLSEVAQSLAVNGMVLAMGAGGGAPLQDALHGTREALAALCADGTCAVDALRALEQLADDLAMLKLQAAMQNEDRVHTTVSNVLKTKHDTAKNAIGNVR